MWKLGAPAQAACREPLSLSQRRRGWGAACHLSQAAAQGQAQSGWLLNPPQMHPPSTTGEQMQPGDGCPDTGGTTCHSALILDRPTITFGLQTICWVKGDEGPKGEEEEKEGRWGGVRLRAALKFATVL